MTDVKLGANLWSQASDWPTFLSAAQMRAGEAPTQTQMVLIDPATGGASALGSRPAVVSDIRGSLQLEMSENPYPRVEVRRSRLP